LLALARAVDVVVRDDIGPPQPPGGAGPGGPPGTPRGRSDPPS
jgi:hypothetical protein